LIFEWKQSEDANDSLQVCVGVAGGMVIGSAKILFQANLMIIILTAYSIAACLTVFSSEEFTNIGSLLLSPRPTLASPPSPSPLSGVSPAFFSPSYYIIVVVHGIDCKPQSMGHDQCVSGLELDVLEY
jgi:hypothetical protein